MPATHHELRAQTIYKLKVGKRLPITAYLCRVPAGFPSPADDHIEKSIDLNERLIRNKIATYILCVEGNSMIGAGIYSGDHLIVDRSIEAKPNDIVIASLDNEFTVKRLVLQDSHLFLTSENPDYSPIPVNGAAELIIWGVVTYTIHKAR
jgi:DNA polymerase V